VEGRLKWSLTPSPVGAPSRRSAQTLRRRSTPPQKAPRVYNDPVASFPVGFFASGALSGMGPFSGVIVICVNEVSVFVKGIVFAKMERACGDKGEHYKERYCIG
jgi:hypothetical protein